MLVYILFIHKLTSSSLAFCFAASFSRRDLSFLSFFSVSYNCCFSNSEGPLTVKPSPNACRCSARSVLNGTVSGSSAANCPNNLIFNDD